MRLRVSQPPCMSSRRISRTFFQILLSLCSHSYSAVATCKLQTKHGRGARLPDCAFPFLARCSPPLPMLPCHACPSLVSLPCHALAVPPLGPLSPTTSSPPNKEIDNYVLRVHLSVAAQVKCLSESDSGPNSLALFTVYVEDRICLWNSTVED